MRFLNNEESWDLLRLKVFGEESCPPQLVKDGKKIAEHCEGLPLTIVTVARLLSKVERTPEYWNEVATTQRKHQLFTDAYDEILKVLYPSYEYLTEQLKVCFLYMGVFPPNYEIPRSKLINLWIAEGFFTQKITGQTPEECAVKCLDELASNSLVMVCQVSTYISLEILDKEIKTCALHSSLLHLCYREARKTNIFYILNSRKDGLGEGMKSQSRLCIHNNVLFGIKDVNKSIEENCATTACSLLCFGPYHQYPVPICFGLSSLQQLDVLTIRFYEFPFEVLKLVQLKYLGLTYNGKLPPFISKLWKLQFLIVHQQMSIKPHGGSLYLPMEIWDMKELKHLQIMGNDLPDHFGSSLENLSTLLDVSSRSCTKGVFERIPFLTKLGVQIELVPDAAKPLSCFDHISNLHCLKSLKCVIVNPEFQPGFVHLRASLPKFPSGLRKLSLNGLGYPWKEMSKIASCLPELEVLKLRYNAFRGRKWEMEENL